MENNPQEETLQSKEPKEKNPVTGLLLGVITFLVLSIVSVLLVLFTDLGNILASKVEDKTEIVVDEQIEEDTEVIALENQGWALYSIPEYGFTVEIPTYTYRQELGANREKVNSYWDVKQSNEAIGEDYDYENNWFEPFHNSLVHNINMTFFPERIPETVACGQGCVREHLIKVYIYQDESSYEEIKGLYVTELNGREEQEELGAESEEVTKWGLPALSFKLISPGGESSGYLLNDGVYTYHIEYFFSETPEESFEVAQKVLDSMKFE